MPKLHGIANLAISRNHKLPSNPGAETISMARDVVVVISLPKDTAAAEIFSPAGDG